MLSDQHAIKENLYNKQVSKTTFPQVSESAAKFRCTAGIDSSYPVGELLICVGLIAVMIIENMAAEYEHVAHQIQLQTRMEEEEDESAALFDPHQKPHNGHSHGHSHDGPGHDHVSHFTMVWRLFLFLFTDFKALKILYTNNYTG